MASVESDMRSVDIPERVPSTTPLHVGPRLWYLWAWFAFLLSLAALAVVGVFNLLDPLFPLQLGFVGLAAIVSLASLVITRATVVWEANETGVRRKRGDRILDEIPWDKVKEVRYGNRWRATIRTRFETEYSVAGFLMVKDRRVLHTLFVDTVYRSVDTAELASFSRHVAAIAKSRGIRVVHEEPGSKPQVE